MTLLERRRQMMSRKTEPEWDYVFEADANGLIPVVNFKGAPYNLKLSVGQKITIAWDATGFDGDTSRMLYLLGSAFNDYMQLSEANAVRNYGQKGIITITSRYTMPSSSFCLSRAWFNTAGPRFMGKYIKVKIHPME